MLLEDLRKEYHALIFKELLSVDEKKIPNNADKYSQISVALAKGIVEEIAIQTNTVKLSGQTMGKSFEKLTYYFLEKVFNEINHLRTGKFEFCLGKSIDGFEQYEHLSMLAETLKNNRQLRAAVGDYLICPDIVIGRIPIDDKEINKNKKLIKPNDKNANLTPLRMSNSQKPILHASISCKWTIRSDRSQNSRTEGLNLIRNRKGHTPHIVIVTGEPYPQRIASLALGTGDIDCVYHFALRELLISIEKLKNEVATDLIETLVQGKRLRDISDLPFDLAI
ncbi:MAG: Restriction endonuclease [Ignavibacteria bacterium]|nr:Restriction endonuclease [Ignavibacteria bacterium]